MMTNNFALYSFKIVGEFIRDIFMFPLWWYSRGLVQLVLSQIKFIRNREKALALMVWVKNIFKPMFGQTDWQGKLISFFMRVFQIIFRSIVLLFWILIAFSGLVLWTGLPILVLYQILFQLDVSF